MRSSRSCLFLVKKCSLSASCLVTNAAFIFIQLGFRRLGMKADYKRIMNIQFRVILTVASLAFALANCLPTEVRAADLKEAQVTQVIQDVRLLPSNASPRPAAVSDNVRQGTAVQTGVQSRSELTFKDKTITRLGEKTIFSVGEGARTIDLGSGQFLLYVPKNSGGAKVKMGPVTAAITG
jgi:FecR protein